MQRDLEISRDCDGDGGGGVIGATKEREGEREVEMTIPFAVHNASHFETKQEPLCREETQERKGAGP